MLSTEEVEEEKYLKAQGGEEYFTKEKLQPTNVLSIWAYAGPPSAVPSEGCCV